MGVPCMAAGIGGRWALGVVILVHVIAYNETGGTTVVLGAFVATACAILADICQKSLAHVQLPYMRTTHRFDFYCQFGALWMDMLALLASCAALARTLSTCMDAMSGGMARIYLLGRNSPDNEPWPDVLGVSVVFLLTVMFMLGLENTRVFGLLMSIGVVGMSVVMAVLCALRGRFDVWRQQPDDSSGHGGDGGLLPQGVLGLLTSAALCTIAYPAAAAVMTTGGGISTNSSGGGGATTAAYKRCLEFVRLLFIGVSLAFNAGCLSTITPNNPGQQQPPAPYIAVPILPLLERVDFHTLQPAVACLLVLACSGAYLELFPAMYGLIVRLTTSDWRILPRQIGYESADSGAPVLAIFTGASLCAMLAFACPLQNLVYMLGSAHLTGGLLRAAYLLYAPLRPKFVVITSQDASLAYSRLDIAAKPPASAQPHHHHHHHHHHQHHQSTSASVSATRSSSLWSFLRKPARSMSMLPTTATKAMLKKTKKKSKRNEELEREWLLLGEPPQSPLLRTTNADATTVIGAGSGDPGDHGIGADQRRHPHQQQRQFNDIECIDVADNDATNRNHQHGNTATTVVDISDDSGSESSCSGSSTTSATSTDIDAIVDEYREKVKVSTAGPIEKPVRLPSLATWRMALCLCACLFAGLLLAAISAALNEPMLLLCGAGTAVLCAAPLALLPRYAHGPTGTPAAITCTVTLLLHAALLGPALTGCWPAIAFWALAGTLLFVRCDRWCCACFDQVVEHGAPRGLYDLRRSRRGSRRRSLLLLPNMAATASSSSMVSSAAASATAAGGTAAAGVTSGGHMTAIRIPCPPRGSLVSSRISGHR